MCVVEREVSPRRVGKREDARAFESERTRVGSASNMCGVCVVCVYTVLTTRRGVRAGVDAEGRPAGRGLRTTAGNRSTSESEPYLSLASTVRQISQFWPYVSCVSATMRISSAGYFSISFLKSLKSE